MNITANILQALPGIETVEPSESTILIPVNPAGLPDDVLAALQMACRPTGTDGDVIRDVIRDFVVRELGRRATADDTIECSAWALPWHRFDDQQLAAALGATYSWAACVDTTREIRDTFDSIHRAVTTAACTRLQEVHTAIQIAKHREGSRDA